MERHEFQQCPQCGDIARVRLDYRFHTAEVCCISCGYYHRQAAINPQVIDGKLQIEGWRTEEERTGIGGLTYSCRGFSWRGGFQGEIDFAGIQADMENILADGEITFFRLTRWNVEARRVEIVAEGGVPPRPN
jgi:hypothetical protein